MTPKATVFTFKANARIVTKNQSGTTRACFLLRQQKSSNNVKAVTEICLVTMTPEKELLKLYFQVRNVTGLSLRVTGVTAEASESVHPPSIVRPSLLVESRCLTT
jgi:hypothetical protein